MVNMPPIYIFMVMTGGWFIVILPTLYNLTLNAFLLEDEVPYIEMTSIYFNHHSSSGSGPTLALE